MKSRFGLHIRLNSSLQDAIEKIQRLDHKFFQTVLMLQSRQFLSLTDESVQQFVRARRRYCDKVFAHAAYWSNLTNIDSRGFYSLQKEIEIAEKLEFTHMVVHAGSFSHRMSCDKRVQHIIKAIDILLASSSTIIILLENSPHKDMSFSANIEELGILFKHYSGNHRVKMCVDTAHAYVSGYALNTPQQVDDFVHLLARHVGIENIGLLHCNDTKKECGSFLDEHAVPGYGKIGMEQLYHFVHHPLLQNIPVIFELPMIDESLESELIEQFIHMETI